MAVLTELFASDHAAALSRADALDAGREPEPAPHVRLSDVTPVDLEVLGEVAARAVRFGSGDLEAAEIDLEHERLLRMPPFWCEVLAELGRAEDAELLSEVAAGWAATEEMAEHDGALEPVVRSVVDLATRAQESGVEVHVWSAETRPAVEERRR